MSKLHFSFTPNLVPPDNLRFTHVDGYVTVASDTKSWYEKIQKHEKDNGREMQEGWKEAAQDQLCRLLPPGWCMYDNNTSPAAYIDIRMGRDDFLRGMATLTRIAVAPDPLVTQEEAESRARNCAACQANILIDGCAPCLGMANLIAAVKGAASTESDPLLKACAICKCSNKAQVWVKSELLANGVTDEQRSQFSMIEPCWKRQALQIPCNSS